MKPQENQLFSYFPDLRQLSKEHRQLILSTCTYKSFAKDETLMHGGKACNGLISIVSGQLRAYIQSPNGKEVTLYRLLPYDICVMTASCLLHNMQFDIHLSAESTTQVLLIPTSTIEKISEVDPIFKQFTLDLMTQRFSDVMWVMEQIAFSAMPARIAYFLMDNYQQKQQQTLLFTHDFIAKELGSAREVISRLLKYMEQEGLIEVGRGKITIKDPIRLSKLSDELL